MKIYKIKYYNPGSCLGYTFYVECANTDCEYLKLLFKKVSHVLNYINFDIIEIKNKND